MYCFKIVSHSLIQSINIILSCSLILFYLFNFVVCCSGTLTPSQPRHLPNDGQHPWVCGIMNTLLQTWAGAALVFFCASLFKVEPWVWARWLWICFCDSCFLKRLWCDVSSDDFALSSLGIGDVTGVVTCVSVRSQSATRGAEALF